MKLFQNHTQHCAALTLRTNAGPYFRTKAFTKSRGTSGGVVQQTRHASHDTLHKAKVIVAKAPEDVKQRLRAGESSIHAEHKSLRKHERTVARLRRVNATGTRVPDMRRRVRLLHSDLASLPKKIPAGSVDCILTDPPYGKDHLHLYPLLADLADRVLRPGGSLLIMTGQSYLPQVFQAFSGSKTLNYQWTIAFLTGVSFTRIWARNVSSTWKPVVWYVKGRFRGEFNNDVVRAEGPAEVDKVFHPWGQNEGTIATLIERFTYRGELVLNPLCGGGVVPFAAARLGRRCIAADTDPQAIRQTAHGWSVG